MNHYSDSISDDHVIQTPGLSVSFSRKVFDTVVLCRISINIGLGAQCQWTVLQSTPNWQRAHVYPGVLSVKSKHAVYCNNNKNSVPNIEFIYLTRTRTKVNLLTGLTQKKKKKTNSV